MGHARNCLAEAAGRKQRAMVTHIHRTRSRIRIVCREKKDGRNGSRGAYVSVRISSSEFNSDIYIYIYIICARASRPLLHRNMTLVGTAISVN